MGNDTDDIFDQAADAVWLAAWFVAFLLPLFIVGYQVLHWLQHGIWKSLPAAIALEYVGLAPAWPYEPHSWFGIARIVRWSLQLPLSLVLPMLVVVVAWGLRKFMRGGG